MLPAIKVIKATTPSHFVDASHLIDAYQQYVIEADLTSCMMGSLDDEIMSPAEFYHPGRGGVFLAYDGEAPLGISCMEEHQPVHADMRCAEIRRMYVVPEARGRQVGEALLKACINEAVRLGYGRVVLDTFLDPTYALKLYKRLGFSECEPFNHLPPGKAVWLEKML